MKNEIKHVHAKKGEFEKVNIEVIFRHNNNNINPSHDK